MGVYSGGTGTQLDPYLISDVDDLIELADELDTTDMYFKQTNDIDVAAVVPWVSIDGFLGHYDGDNYEIQNLTLSSEQAFITDGNGMAEMFYYVAPEFHRLILRNFEPNLKNIKIVDAVATFDDGYNGILIAWASDGFNIQNCHVINASITSTDDSYTGGLVGGTDWSTWFVYIGECSVSGTISGTSVELYQAAGIVSDCNGCLIEKCVVDIDVTGDCVGYGGIVGCCYAYVQIYECVVNGSVVCNGIPAGGWEGVGGFIDYLYHSGSDFTQIPTSLYIKDCICELDMSAVGDTNGNLVSMTIAQFRPNVVADFRFCKNIIFTGLLPAHVVEPAIDIISTNTITMDNVYYDSTLNPFYSNYATAKTTAELKNVYEFLDVFDSSVWSLKNGEYPRLKFESDVNFDHVLRNLYETIQTKSEIKEAIKDMGVYVDDDTLAEYATRIAEINGYTQEDYFDFDPETQTITGYNGGLTIDSTPFTPTEGDGNFSGGYGTEASPYLVSTYADLLAIDSFPTAHYKQVCNIDMRGHGVWLGICGGNGGGDYFTGVYDGDNYVILNMFTDDSSDSGCGGLFSQTMNATVKNIRIYNAQMISMYRGYANGVMVGWAEDSSFENCHVIDAKILHVNGYGSAGFCGYAYGSTFLNCTAKSTIRAPYVNSGGDNGGFSSNSDISSYTNCHAHVEMTHIPGPVGGGGFIGLVIDQCIIEKCSASGFMYCEDGTGDDVGGFIARVELRGDTLDSTIIDCSTSVNIINVGLSGSTGAVGGFIGYVVLDNGGGTLTITNCISTSEVLSYTGTDAFIDDISDDPITVTNCFYNNVNNTNISVHALATTPLNMSKEATFTTFDFVNDWEMGFFMPEIKDAWPTNSEFSVDRGLVKISIPPTIEGIAVLHIADSAFRSEEITEVIIPDGVLTIGDFAFCDNQITNITIPDSVTEIGDYAFYMAGINELNIGVNIIGDFGFAMNKMESANFSGENYDERVIGDYTFIGNNLQNLEVSAYSFGIEAFRTNYNIGVLTMEYFHSIGYSTFNDCGITEILGNPFINATDSYGTKSIGDRAFVSNKITTLLNFNITDIGEDAFSQMQYANKITLIQFGEDITTIPWGAFSDHSITKLNLKNIDAVAYSAFSSSPVVEIIVTDNLVFTSPYYSIDQLGLYTGAFMTKYNAEGKAAGTYTYNGSSWDYTPNKI